MHEYRLEAENDVVDWICVEEPEGVHHPIEVLVDHGENHDRSVYASLEIGLQSQHRLIRPVGRDTKVEDPRPRRVRHIRLPGLGVADLQALGETITVRADGP